MKAIRGPKMLLALGVVFLTGPLWGLVITTSTMAANFESRSDQAHSGIQSGFLMTVFGMNFVVPGAFLIAAGLIWRKRVRSRQDPAWMRAYYGQKLASGQVRDARIVLVAVGAVTLFVAVAGLLYNTVSLSRVSYLQELTVEHELHYFYPVYCVMSGICVASFLGLAYCGWHFIRARNGILSLFIGILLCEIVYFFTMIAISVIPGFGSNISAAAGVASGGLVFQGLLLFPVWAPLLATWASDRLNVGEGNPENDRDMDNIDEVIPHATM
ncbi:MAG: hypothetical protein AMXMBFR84_38880 [Candidatus Hydrogenedentota bacterium]